MLVLTRRAGESIVIGDDVRVVVLDVRGDTVRLGIDAPRSIQVHRAEVYAEVQAANAAAVNRAGDLGSVAERLQRMARPAPPKPRPQPPTSPVPGAPVAKPSGEPSPPPAGGSAPTR
jgi:carbon storage regulator